MSWTQNRTTESWNNDPNNFSNPSGPDNTGAFSQQRGGWQGQRDGSNDQQWCQDQESRPIRDPTDTSTWGTDTTSRRQRQNQFGRNHFDSGGNDWDNQGARGHWTGSNDIGSTGTAGNTTDVNTFGAGGNAFGTSGEQYGSRAGGSEYSGTSGNQFGTELQGGFREGDSWHRSQDIAGTGEKPSKVKGTMEKLTDRVIGRQ